MVMSNRIDVSMLGCLPYSEDIDGGLYCYGEVTPNSPDYANVIAKLETGLAEIERASEPMESIAEYNMRVAKREQARIYNFKIDDVMSSK
jgi:hypothetical protein